MLKYYLFLIIGCLLALETAAQTPISLERNSVINLELKRSSKKSFALALKVDDILSFDAIAEGGVNFKIAEPSGQIIYQNIIKSEKAEWQKTISTEGIYTVEVENPGLLFVERISISISILRNDFIYGHPSMDSLVSKRNRKTFVDGEFQITRKAPKTFNYSLEKGDTLLFKIKPKSGSGPAIEIQNSLNELVYAAFSSKREHFAEIPIFETGSYTITMNSQAYLPNNNHLNVELISPARYMEVPKVVEETESETVEKPKQLYDTIAEIYIDTIFFLGAKRDIINRSEQTIKFQFEEPSSIIKWLVFYGSGKEFMDQVNSLSILIQDEAMAVGASNILAAYGLDLIKTLPKSDNKQIKFTPSPIIRSKLKPPLRSNYATIDTAYGNHTLLIENLSQSAGQKVYVQTVILRKIRLDNQ